MILRIDKAENVFVKTEDCGLNFIEITATVKRGVFEAVDVFYERTLRELHDKYIGIVDYKIDGWADTRCTMLRYTLKVRVNK